MIPPVFLQAEQFFAAFGALFLLWLALIFVFIFVWWWIGSLSFRTKKISEALQALNGNIHYVAKWLEANHDIRENIAVAAGSLATISRVFQEEQAHAHKDDAPKTPPADTWKNPGVTPE